jgi:hypothetical protein
VQFSGSRWRDVAARSLRRPEFRAESSEGLGGHALLSCSDTDGCGAAVKSIGATTGLMDIVIIRDYLRNISWLNRFRTVLMPEVRTALSLPAQPRSNDGLLSGGSYAALAAA